MGFSSFLSGFKNWSKVFCSLGWNFFPFSKFKAFWFVFWLPTQSIFLAWFRIKQDPLFAGGWMSFTESYWTFDSPAVKGKWSRVTMLLGVTISPEPEFSPNFFTLMSGLNSVNGTIKTSSKKVLSKLSAFTYRDLFSFISSSLTTFSSSESDFKSWTKIVVSPSACTKLLFSKICSSFSRLSTPTLWPPLPLPDPLFFLLPFPLSLSQTKLSLFFFVILIWQKRLFHLAFFVDCVKKKVSIGFYPSD